MLEGIRDTEGQRLPEPFICDNCCSDNIQCVPNHRPEERSDFIWKCADCKAQVGCHSGTRSPFGRMTSLKVRKLRVAVHAVFDPIWINTSMARDEAYNWLAAVLNIDANECHIAMLSEEQLLVAYHKAKDFYQVRLASDERRKQKKRERSYKQSQREKRRTIGRKNN